MYSVADYGNKYGDLKKSKKEHHESASPFSGTYRKDCILSLR